MIDDEFFAENECKLEPTPSKPANIRKKPKVTVDWSDDNINKLIESVQMHECLWNPSDPEYRNKHIRNNLWQEIAEHNFNNQYSAGDLLAKWGNMRIQFRSYSAKKKQAKSDQDVENKIAWKFFNSMMFIERLEDPLTTKSDLNLSLDNSVNFCESIQHDETLRKKRKIAVSSSSSSDAINPQVGKVVVPEINGGIQKISDTKRDDDQFGIFGNFIASELRAIGNVHLANKIKRKLNRVLLDCLDELDGTVATVKNEYILSS